MPSICLNNEKKKTSLKKDKRYQFHNPKYKSKREQKTMNEIQNVI